jgi:hypothetical protein
MMQWRSNAILLVLAFFCLSSSSVFAACHAVSAAGAGTKDGSSWTNAFQFSSLSPVRGDVYYFADGTYGTLDFETAASGTLTVTFKKAQSYDFGRTSDGCSNDISSGWNASTMGASQAVFNSNSFGATIYVNAPYFVMNGNGTTATSGCGGTVSQLVALSFTASPPNAKDCGFKLDNHTGGAAKEIYNASPSTSQMQYSYVEIAASAINSDQEITGGVSGDTYTHMYGHNSGCVYFQYTGDNKTVSYSFWNGTETQGGSACHGQYLFENGSTSNGTEHHNVYKDITGTAVYTFANTSQNHNNWVFYDNVYTSTSNSSDLGHLSDGIVACINNGSCTNFLFYDNSIINVGGAIGIEFEVSPGTGTVRNNLWYNAQPPSGGYLAMDATEDHNSFLHNSGLCGTGTADVCDDSSGSPFVNWQAGNFALASDASDWNNRASLASPFNADMVGTVFSTDRGAYQFGAGGGTTPPTPPTPPPATPPAPPTNLVGTVH